MRGQTKTPRYRRLALVLLIGVSFLYQITVLWLRPNLNGDERLISLRTIHHWDATGDLLVRPYGNGYMAPVHELFSFWLVRLFGEQVWCLRFPAWMFTALSTAAIFEFLRRVAPVSLAFQVCLLWVIANPAVVLYTGIANTAGVFAIYVFLTALLSRTKWEARQLFGLGLLAGAACYIYPLAELFLIGALAWSLIRIGFPSRIASCFHSLSQRERLAMAAAAGTSALVAAAFGYYHLTRRDTFIWNTPSMALFWATLVGGTVLIYVTRSAWVLSRKQYVLGAIFATGMTAVLLPVELWYNLVERPALELKGVRIWEANVYHLRHLHEYGNQILLFSEGILPCLILGEMPQSRVGATETITWRSWLWIFLGSVLIMYIAQKRTVIWGKLKRNPDLWLALIPAIAIIALLIPSWRLSNGYHYRYLVPFLPLYFMAALSLLRLQLGSKAAWVVTGLGCAYNLVMLAFAIWNSSP